RKAGGFAAMTNAELAELIGRTGRKVGIALICASQDTTLKAFGGSGPLRSSLLRGNCAVMYSTNRISSGILPNFDSNPADLPDGGGYAYSMRTTDATGAGHSRDAVFRAAYQEDFAPDMARYPVRPLEREPATVIGMYMSGAYRRRHEVSAEDRAAAVASYMDDLLAGRVDIAEMLNGRGGPAPQAAAAQAAVVADLPGLSAVPTLADLVATPVEDDEDLVDASGLTPVQAAVLQAVRDGITRTGDIPETIGRSRRAVYNARDSLIERGHLVQPERGRLALAPPRAA